MGAANCLAAPMAAALLMLDGLFGLHGWQILFFVEVCVRGRGAALPWLCGRLARRGAAWVARLPRAPFARAPPLTPGPHPLRPAAPQGLPSVLLGALIWRSLPRAVHDARFLSSTERAWLAAASSPARRHAEQAESLGGRRMLRDALSNGRLWAIMGVGVMKNAALNGCAPARGSCVACSPSRV